MSDSQTTDEERFEAGFVGHGRGVVISNDGNANFSERGMTSPELEARRWALNIAGGVNDLYRRGSAAFVYHRVWEFVALAIADAETAERRRCAEIADNYGREGDRLGKEFACETADEIAARIRM